jgi:hypothetical protein
MAWKGLFVYAGRANPKINRVLGKPVIFKEIYMNRKCIVVFLILTLVFSLNAFGQVKITGSAAYGFTQAGRARSNLTVRARGSEQVFSYDVASTIGGVLFQATAIPAGNAVNQTVSLRYNPALEDGRRLTVTIGNVGISPVLYDWQIIPVARYADSGYTACITLLGERTDAEMETHTLDSMYLEVHPALSDTLIGFNLFLVDAMLIYPYRMWQITDSFSGTVRGYHDITPNKTKSALNMVRISSILEEPSYPWHSYIYTDCETDITYNVTDGQLVFTGVPSYRFFRTDAENRTITMSHELNDAIIQRQIRIRDINSTVYTSAEKTAQWAAFFRAVQERNPDGWQGFMGQIADVQAEPAMTIPRVWHRFPLK